MYGFSNVSNLIVNIELSNTYKVIVKRKEAIMTIATHMPTRVSRLFPIDCVNIGNLQKTGTIRLNILIEIPV